MHIFHNAMQHIIKAPSTEAAITAGEEPSALGKRGGCTTLLSSRSWPRCSKLDVCWPALAMRLGQQGSPMFFKVATFY